MAGPDPQDPSSCGSSSTAIAAESVNEDELFASLKQPDPSGSDSSADEQQQQPLPHQPPAEGTLADALGGDGGSGSNPGDLGIDLDKYPASMTSSIRQHVYEGGLRYHAFRDGRYAFPNDEVEQNRDDMKHAMTLMLMHGEHLYAPVAERLEEGGSVYDLGTGTGIWAIELADKYPRALIRGCDLSPIQPNYIPPNCHFVVDDFEDEWLYPENSFDYIHIRHALHTIHDIKTLLEQCYRHLKPGGYLEVHDLHGSPHCDDASVTPSTPYALRDFLGYLDAGLRALGPDLHAITGLPDAMRAARFGAVRRVVHKCPIGVWPRDRRLRYCGLFMRTVLMDGLRGLALRPFGTGLGWTPLQIEVFLVDVRRAVMDSGFHTYFPLHVVYGQKPVE